MWRRGRRNTHAMHMIVREREQPEKKEGKKISIVDIYIEQSVLR